MPQSARRPLALPFSEKYDRQHAQAYLEKHRDGVARRLSHWRDERLARKALALADEPTLVLDLPCGAGRFWPLLVRRENRIVIGADNSRDMLDVACRAQPPRVLARVRTLQTSAFDIALPAHAVDCVFCMRLLHHIGEAEHRIAILREFHRVTRDTVIVSMWVDGNVKSWRRARLERHRSGDSRNGRDFQNRFVVPARTAETEFRSAGFDVLGHFDFLPGYAMWRVYVLRRVAA